MKTLTIAAIGGIVVASGVLMFTKKGRQMLRSVADKLDGLKKAEEPKAAPTPAEVLRQERGDEIVDAVGGDDVVNRIAEAVMAKAPSVPEDGDENARLAAHLAARKLTPAEPAAACAS